MNAPVVFRAYYYKFEATGVPEIDAILAAVASAGKKYHSTIAWNDTDVFPTSCVEEIQSAANTAAEAWRAKR